MKLLTYPPRVQSVGGGEEESVTSGAGWDFASRVWRLQRKSTPPAPSSDVCGTPSLNACGTASSYICGTASSPTVGRQTSSSLEERKEPRSWLVDGSRLGLPLGPLCLYDVSVSSAADVPLGLE